MFAHVISDTVDNTHTCQVCNPEVGHGAKLILFVLFQCSDGNSAQDNSSLKRVAVVEDFFDIIYAMHVEMGADPGRAPKHAGQKKTYKAVSKHRDLPVWLLADSDANRKQILFPPVPASVHINTTGS